MPIYRLPLVGLEELSLELCLETSLLLEDVACCGGVPMYCLALIGLGGDSRRAMGGRIGDVRRRDSGGVSGLAVEGGSSKFTIIPEGKEVCGPAPNSKISLSSSRHSGQDDTLLQADLIKSSGFTE